MKAWLEYDRIHIRREKKKFLSREIKTIDIAFYIHDIKVVHRQEDHGKFVGIGFELKNNDYEYILSEEVSDLSRFYQDLLDFREKGNHFKVVFIDVETAEERTILE